nr:GGDEF domain-containing protein [Lysinibacillus timonensis]
MKYTGRIVVMFIYFSVTATFKLTDYFQLGYVPIFEYLFSALLIYPAYWTGKKYDEAKFYYYQLLQTKQLLQENEEKLRQLAFYDSLTNAANRRLFEERILQSIEDCKQLDQKIAVMYMDIDNFKAINDELGHDIGDELLKQFAERVRNCLRQTDVLARLGGDEFVILLAEIKDPEDTLPVVKRILDVLQDPWTIYEHSFNITSSIGIAVYEDDEDYISLLKRADVALLEVKRSGRNAFKIANFQMESVFN